MTNLKNFKKIFPPNELPFRIFFNPDCMLHDTGFSYPECAQRLQSIIEGCLSLANKDFICFNYPPAASISQLTSLHPRDYLTRLETQCLQGREFFMSLDNPICPQTFDAILAAGGLAIALGNHLNSRKGGFALTRPPGHHAGIAKAEGFCFLNHAGLIERQIRKEYPKAKIFIIDFDVHHGNGTSDIFLEDNRIFYMSIHSSPKQTYPGSGHKDEKGERGGKGYTLNLPLPVGTDGDTWLKTVESNITEAISVFNPDFMLISAGFDAHVDDPFALMRVEDKHYLSIVSTLIAITETYCPGRLGIILEGGYSLDVLRHLVPEIISQLSAFYNRD